MDEPIRHMRIDAALVRRMRRLTPEQKLLLGSGLSQDALAFAKQGGRKPWSPRPPNAS